MASSRAFILVCSGLVLACTALMGCSLPSGPGATSSESGLLRVETRTIELPYRAFGMACKVGEALYLNVDSGTGNVDTLMRYDLSTGTTETIFTTPEFVASVTANERWLLWESDKRLYAQPIAGGKRQELANTREMYAPALEGDVAAWVDWDPVGKHRIVTQNLRTGEKKTVARSRLPGFYNNFMQLKDGQLLWTDIYEGTGHYVVHDVSTGKTEDYPVPNTQYRYPGYAMRDGDVVYSINFDRFDEWDWTQQRVTRYSLKSGELKSFDTTGSISFLEVGRGSVAIIDPKMHLLVGANEPSYPRTDMSENLGTPMDGMKMSSDGKTLVAGYSVPEKSETTLYVMKMP